MDVPRKTGILQRCGVGMIVGAIIAACVLFTLVLTALVLLTPNPISRVVLNPGYYDHLHQGRSLDNAGDVRGASAHYAEMVRLRPDWPGGYYYYGNACYRLGRYREALSSYTQALERHPNAKLRLTLIQYRAITARDCGAYDQAADDYATLMRLDSVDRGWTTNRLECLLGGKHYREVIAEADRMLAQPGAQYAFAYWLRGTAQGQLGNSRAAVADLRAATRLDRRNPIAWGDRGWWEYRAGLLRESMESSRTAIRTGGSDTTPRLNLALCEAVVGQNRQSLADYEAAARSASPERRHAALVVLRQAMVQHPSAAPVLNQAAHLLDDGPSQHALAPAAR